MYFNFIIYWVGILMEKDYELDLTKGGFASLLRYEKNVSKDGTNVTGKTLPDITRGGWLGFFLCCDLITRVANDLESNVLYSLSIVDRCCKIAVRFNSNTANTMSEWSQLTCSRDVERPTKKSGTPQRGCHKLTLNMWGVLKSSYYNKLTLNMWGVLKSSCYNNRQVSYPFKEDPYWLKWRDVNKPQIDLIWITDGRNNIIDLNGIDVALNIMIEEEYISSFCIWRWIIRASGQSI